ncbi:MAG: alpha-galactosidase [Lachnospiraceae bacterium]|nr:alpha-galactosidase [Lachnospiraceae bacterium]
MIQYDETHQIFKLDTPHTSYIFGLADNYPGHIYYGKKLGDTDLAWLLRTEDRPQPPSVLKREKTSFFDFFPMEYPFEGVGDFRECCINIRTEDGQEGLELTYQSHRIFRGKRVLPGLPSTQGEDSSTLEVELLDKVTGLTVVLSYTVFDDTDAVAQSVRVRNGGERLLFLTKVLSACLHVEPDMGAGQEMEVLTLPGSWARERSMQRQKMGYGTISAESKRGVSSHQSHPFMALVSKNCTQTVGEVYAMNFVYSGNFAARVMKDQFDRIRMVMGIHPERFCWKLAPGEEFQAPEVVLVYSDEGLGKMTRSFHDLYRKHLIRGYWKDRRRPVLINNWEATYFNFNTEKLLEIAREAAKAGIEMLVVDDGWFGHREMDDSSLGDWTVNEEKLPGGFRYLADEVNRLGMKLGIWLEPEMISEDSDLYRAHPDWALQLKGREPGQCRAQYVLDLSRQEVRAYIYDRIKEVLSSANIEYVKWDMNRPLADVGNAVLPPDQQGEISHRYMLAVYEMQERLLKDFPKLLLENCSSGGGRFDPGMLYYSPQIWCSDDTDAVERLAIQEGTQLLYPLSSIGAHVSACPNHQTGRTVPFEMRGIAALSGTFGYELDITRLSEDEKKQILEQTKLCRQYSALIREGDYYRLESWQRSHAFDSYMVVSKDRKEALLTCVQVLSRPNRASRRLRLQGLDPEAFYEIEGKSFQGATLMYAGLLIPPAHGDFQARLIPIRQMADAPR